MEKLWTPVFLGIMRLVATEGLPFIKNNSNLVRLFMKFYIYKLHHTDSDEVDVVTYIIYIVSTPITHVKLTYFDQNRLYYK